MLPGFKINFLEQQPGEAPPIDLKFSPGPPLPDATSKRRLDLGDFFGNQSPEQEPAGSVPAPPALKHAASQLAPPEVSHLMMLESRPALPRRLSQTYTVRDGLLKNYEAIYLRRLEQTEEQQKKLEREQRRKQQQIISRRKRHLSALARSQNLMGEDIKRAAGKTPSPPSSPSASSQNEDQWISNGMQIPSLKKKLKSYHEKVDDELLPMKDRRERRNPKSSLCPLDQQDARFVMQPSVLAHLDEIKEQTRHFEEGRARAKE